MIPGTLALAGTHRPGGDSPGVAGKEEKKKKEIPRSRFLLLFRLPPLSLSLSPRLADAACCDNGGLLLPPYLQQQLTSLSEGGEGEESLRPACRLDGPHRAPYVGRSGALEAKSTAGWALRKDGRVHGSRLSPCLAQDRG